MPPPRQRGQSSVELIALVPVIVVAALLAWQLAVTAHTWLSAAGAARAAARAQAVGAPAREAALAALPAAARDGVRVTVAGDEVRVRLRAPRLAPWLPRLDALALEAAAPVVRGES